MQKLTRQPFIITFIALFMLAQFAVPLSHANAHKDLEKAMKKMGRSFKAVREAGDDAFAMVEPLQSLHTHARAVLEKGLAPHDSTEAQQQEFVQGMEELISLVEQAVATADADDLTATRALLRKIGAVRKKYHCAFDVQSKKNKNAKNDCPPK